MNNRIREIAEQAGIINYVDLETPRRYFIDGNADLEELIKFAELIICECAKIADTAEPYKANDLILEHFGVTDENIQ